ncbi:MAG: hypothetical protein U1E92_03230 [Moraxella osloensis]
MNLSNVNDAASSLNGAYFVTGTDTEIGKTTTTAQLVKNMLKKAKSSMPSLQGYGRHGVLMIPVKHIAMMQGASINLPMSNHHCLSLRLSALATPCSPHIAAQLDNDNSPTPN